MCGDATILSSSEHRIHATSAWTASSLLSATRPNKRCSKPSNLTIRLNPPPILCDQKMGLQINGHPMPPNDARSRK